ncbi:hypothetical protein [Amycolatopsis sp. H20-H5]|uniref:hypothetical protein n=1 Tax=Amycolatopsis sp. H20-H5 TaxID=3046309 RepID=UPI002DBD4A7A|nr:hypothetical protein [Amycolatopsis sp. H20-H5]MEC3977834.1 hypothetical protein [Amycolatopsis sp. H20-H5]
MVDIKAAMGALRADAGIWDIAAQDTDGPRQAIGALGLTPYDVSMYGVDKGIDKTYAGAQQALMTMLQQAAENFHNLAGALRHAADLYDQGEADHQERLKNAAEPGN